MGVGVEASSTTAPPQPGLLYEPVDRGAKEQPESDAQNEDRGKEPASDRWFSLAKWPVVFVVALVEIAWLVAAAYLVHDLIVW